MASQETAIRYRKSSRSSSNGGQCVEVGRIPGSSTVAVRDSKHPDGPALHFTRAEWEAFLAGAKEDEFSFEALGG